MCKLSFLNYQKSLGDFNISCWNINSLSSLMHVHVLNVWKGILDFPFMIDFCIIYVSRFCVNPVVAPAMEIGVGLPSPQKFNYLKLYHPDPFPSKNNQSSPLDWLGLIFRNTLYLELPPPHTSLKNYLNPPLVLWLYITIVVIAYH